MRRVVGKVGKISGYQDFGHRKDKDFLLEYSPMVIWLYVKCYMLYVLCMYRATDDWLVA